MTALLTPLFRFISTVLLIFCLLILLQTCKDKKANPEVERSEVEQESESEKQVQEISITEDVERDSWQKPKLVLAKMGDLSGKTVVDIGAGTGYFTFPLALSAKRVIATDIEASFLDYINQRKQEYYPHLESKIVTRLTEPTDPRIESNEADWVMLVNTYQYLPDKIQYLSRVRSGLKKNGKLLLIDFKEQPSRKIKPDYPVVSINEISGILSAAGFSRITVDNTTLPYQYIIVAFR